MKKQGLAKLFKIGVGMDNLVSIKKIPTVYNKIHESVFRSYHILRYTIEMLERGDSKETILEIVKFLRDDPSETVKPFQDTDFVAKTSVKHHGIKEPI